MKLAVVGAGYVGLVSSACLADFGHDVVCIDNDPAKIEALEAGSMPIYAPGLESIVADIIRQGRLSFGTGLREAVLAADAVFIAVGTPSRRGDGFADLSFVHEAAREIAASLSGYTVNDQRKRAMARGVIRACGGSVRGKTIALLGLIFKPDTDEMREAPSLAIVAGLEDAGAKVRAYDPEGIEQARNLLPRATFTEDAYSCAIGADTLVLVSEWSAFRAVDFCRIRKVMAIHDRRPPLIVLRNVNDRQIVEMFDFCYVQAGKSMPTDQLFISN